MDAFFLYALFLYAPLYMPLFLFLYFLYAPFYILTIFFILSFYFNTMTPIPFILLLFSFFFVSIHQYKISYIQIYTFNIKDISISFFILKKTQVQVQQRSIFQLLLHLPLQLPWNWSFHRDDRASCSATLVPSNTNIGNVHLVQLVQEHICL